MLKGLAISRLGTSVKIKFHFISVKLERRMGLEVALYFHRTANVIQATAFM